MNAYLPNDLDIAAQLVGVSAIVGAAIGVLVATCVDTVREVRDHRRLHRRIRALLAEHADIDTGTSR